MIYVECKPDGVLVLALSNLPKRQVLHENNKFEVCKRVSRQKNCTGVIDEDPGSVEPAYLQQLLLAEDATSSSGLKLLYDSSRDNHIIVVCPRLEDWIIRTAKTIDVHLEDYRLPLTSNLLHRVINLDLTKFERLLETLRSSARMRALREMLTA